jgi:hypothetical protein
MRASATLSAALLLGWSLLAVSCGTRTGPGQLEYDTAEGDEVAVSCPVDFPPLDPTVEFEMPPRQRSLSERRPYRS